MRIIRTLVWLAAIAGCKQRAADPAPKPPRDAAVDAVALDAAPATAKAELLFDPTDDNDTGLRVVFGPRAPRLPAVSADGTQIARLESSATGPMFPPPISLVIEPLGASKAKPETFELIDEPLAMTAQDSHWNDAPPAEPIARRLHDRGMAALARLRAGGFTSLAEVELVQPTDGTPPKPGISRVAGYKLELIHHADESLDLGLRDARNALVQREHLATYDQGSFNGGEGQVPCTYRPWVSAGYVDAALRHVYLAITFGWHEECDRAPQSFLVWEIPAAGVAAFGNQPVAPTAPVTPTAAATRTAAIAAVVAQQFDLIHDVDDAAKSFLAGAQLIHTSGIGTPDYRTFRVAEHNELYVGHADHDTTITLSADGKTAWASLTTALEVLPQNEPGRADPWRASDVLVQTPAGWRIAAATWSEPQRNADVNRLARAGKLSALPALEAEPDPAEPATPRVANDAELERAFDALITAGLDPAARPDLIAIGSGPGERTVGSAALAKGWNAAWKGHVEVAARVARRAPSGTTGWVVANVLLAKPGYRVPFQLFCVFDRTGDRWQLVHLHIAV